MYLKPSVLSVVLFIVGMGSFIPAHAIVQLLGDLTYEYQVSQGQVINGQLQIYNPDATQATIQVVKKDADTRKQNRHHSRSNLRWMTLSQEMLTIAPRSTVNVSYRIQIPRGVAQGTHWSKLFIEPVSQNQTNRINEAGTYTVGIKQKVRYSVNIMTHVGEGRAQLTFQSPKIMKKQSQRFFQFDIHNQGSQHSLPEVSIDIFTQQGQRVRSIHGNQRGLFPGYSKTFEISLQGIHPGQYKALLVATDQKTGRTFGTDINLTIKP